MNDEISVAVLSDLHAYESVDDPDKRPSFYCLSDDINDTPVGALFNLIQKDGLRADIVLCPGDLGDKASPAGIKDAWTRVHEVATQLGASLVAGTVGNHDVDSRGAFNDYDPIGWLQRLTPGFPLSDENQNDRFWARHVTVHVEPSRYRLVVLNTSAFHGYGAEYKHGRISDLTMKYLETSLELDTDEYPINILLCHHHPHKHSEYSLGEYDEMAGGQLLLELLGNGRFGDWLVVHGHKHHPKLCYSHGSSSAPTVFSAGSLCHCLYPKLSTVAQRQFYLLKFSLPDISHHGLVGTFRAWDWEVHNGWGEPTRRSGLPREGGFGFRCNPRDLAREAASIVGARMSWASFLAAVPKVRYLTPDDLKVLVSKLESEHSINVHFDGADIPTEIGAAP